MTTAACLPAPRLMPVGTAGGLICLGPSVAMGLDLVVALAKLGRPADAVTGAHHAEPKSSKKSDGAESDQRELGKYGAGPGSSPAGRR